MSQAWGVSCGHRHIHASKQFELEYWTDKEIQQKNFGEQHRHEN